MNKHDNLTPLKKELVNYYLELKSIEDKHTPLYCDNTNKIIKEVKSIKDTYLEEEYHNIKNFRDFLIKSMVIEQSLPFSIRILRNKRKLKNNNYRTYILLEKVGNYRHIEIRLPHNVNNICIDNDLTYCEDNFLYDDMLKKSKVDIYVKDLNQLVLNYSMIRNGISNKIFNIYENNILLTNSQIEQKLKQINI